MLTYFTYLHKKIISVEYLFSEDSLEFYEAYKHKVKDKGLLFNGAIAQTSPMGYANMLIELRLMNGMLKHIVCKVVELQIIWTKMFTL